MIIKDEKHIWSKFSEMSTDIFDMKQQNEVMRLQINALTELYADIRGKESLQT